MEVREWLCQDALGRRQRVRQILTELGGGGAPVGQHSHDERAHSDLRAPRGSSQTLCGLWKWWLGRAFLACRAFSACKGNKRSVQPLRTDFCLRCLFSQEAQENLY